MRGDAGPPLLSLYKNRLVQNSSVLHGSMHTVKAAPLLPRDAVRCCTRYSAQFAVASLYGGAALAVATGCGHWQELDQLPVVHV